MTMRARGGVLSVVELGMAFRRRRVRRRLRSWSSWLERGGLCRGIRIADGVCSFSPFFSRLPWDSLLYCCVGFSSGVATGIALGPWFLLEFDILY